MGMFDDVKCDADLPGVATPPGSLFQTKSLFCSMAHFTITPAGRLIYHRRRAEKVGELAIGPNFVLPQYKQVPVEDLDMNYHGDLWLCAYQTERGISDFVARFTHGDLEWIRPFAELPETHQNWLYLSE